MSARRRKTNGPDRRVDHEVVIIGAGLSGIGVARDLLRAGVSDITIFERAAAVGGTWRDNVYPGIGVDVPAQAYQFRDACNPEWSRFYAKGPEVLAYIERLTDDFGVRALIRFNSEVGERHWDDDADLWRMKVNGKDVTARFVVVAAGPFPEPKPAELPGLDDFAGTILKSASWDQRVDLAGKRVAIIGTGASAYRSFPRSPARSVASTSISARRSGSSPSSIPPLRGSSRPSFAGSPWRSGCCRRGWNSFMPGCWSTASCTTRTSRSSRRRCPASCAT
nr:NAD(P)/FAD-dependent oxidoreductase [Mycobacteroides abscessus]